MVLKPHNVCPKFSLNMRRRGIFRETPETKLKKEFLKVFFLSLLTLLTCQVLRSFQHNGFVHKFRLI